MNNNSFSYENLGVQRVINAQGTVTTLGGNIMFPRAAEAMVGASNGFIDLYDFSKKSGCILASLLGVEAAMITSGAAAGLTIAAAATMVGSDQIKIANLPLSPVKNEIIIQCSHRNPFERALVIAGAKLVQVGNAIETHPFDVDAVISENTAAMVYFLQSSLYPCSLSLTETIAICKKHGIPLIVDAAAELPPKSNLWSIANEGADIVVFSGGKEIRGPQTSGLLVGKRDIINNCMLQTAPFEYSVARPMKAGKEIIAGLLTAVKEYLAEDEAERFILWDQICDDIKSGLSEISSLVVEKVAPVYPKVQPAIIPRLMVKTRGNSNDQLKNIVIGLKQGTPPILVESTPTNFVINPQTLQLSDSRAIIERIHVLLR
jgi:uncharacterized pyridoxal phosphate-dependent enzyme